MKKTYKTPESHINKIEAVKCVLFSVSGTTAVEETSTASTLNNGEFGAKVSVSIWDSNDTEEEN